MKKPSAAEQRIHEIHEKMESANSFIRALDVPADLAPAFLTGRVELIRLAKPRPLTEDECRVLYNLIGGLLETNQVLREHATAVSDAAGDIAGAVHGLSTVSERLRLLANWREDVSEEEEAS